MPRSRFILSCLLSISCLLSVPSSAPAHLSIITQGLSSGDVPETGDLHGSALAVGDFDGDGFEDLAAGAPDEDQGVLVGGADGGLTINYGHPRGLTHLGAQFVTIGDDPDFVIRFGSALAAGDFDDDGYDDLAVGAPELDVLGVTGAGAVFVYYGSAQGLVPSAPDVFDQADIGEVNEIADNWGSALTVGDFDGDGYDDLAVGAFNENGSDGMVSVLRGASGGLIRSGAQSFLALEVGSIGIPDMQFGWALAAGQVTGSAHEDLIVGAPGEEIGGLLRAGRVYVVPGSAAGVSTAESWSFDAGDTDQGISPDSPNEFGYSLAVGAFQNAGQELLDIAVGEPGWDLVTPGDTESSVGRVVVATPSTTAPEASFDTVIRAGLDLRMEPNDRLGEAVAAGDFDQDGTDDLAISGPGIDVDDDDGNLVASAGKVYVTYGPALASSDGWDPVDLNDRDYQANLRMGQALAFGHFDDSGRANLAVGAPNKDYDVWVSDQGPDLGGAGQVYVVAPWRQVQRLGARSTLAINCENEVVFSLHPFKRVPLASVTKTMTALLGCEAIDAGLSPFTVHSAASWYETNLPCNCWPFVETQQTSFIDLMRITMGRSANDAAYAVADVLTGPLAWAGDLSLTVADFVDDMNAKAQALGMNRTIYSNPAGYGAPHYSFGVRPYSTAWDQGILALAAMENECVAEIVGTNEWNILTLYPAGSFLEIDVLVNRQLTNSFKTGFDDYHPQAIGMKGGLTDEAQRTAMYAVRNPAPTEDSIVVGGGFGFEDLSDRYRQGAYLMNLALSTCADGFPVNLPPEPPEDAPAGTFTGVSVCEDQFTEVSVSLTEFPFDPVELIIQAWGATPQATFDLAMRRQLVVAMELNDIITVGLDRFQISDGWEITNVGNATADLLVGSVTPGVDTFVFLEPGESYTIPLSQSAFERENTVTVQNLVAGETSIIQIEMLLHRLSPLSLADEEDNERIHFQRDGGTVLSDDLDVIVLGTTLDCSDPGDATVSLSFNGGPGTPTSVQSDRPTMPLGQATIRLLPNQPNPFNPATTVHYELIRPSPIRLDVYDLAGRHVRNLVSGTMQAAGQHRQFWDGRDASGSTVSSGVYVVRLEALGEVRSRRLVLLK